MELALQLLRLRLERWAQRCGAACPARRRFDPWACSTEGMAYCRTRFVGAVKPPEAVRDRCTELQQHEGISRQARPLELPLISEPMGKWNRHGGASASPDCTAEPGVLDRSSHPVGHTLLPRGHRRMERRETSLEP